MTLAKLIKDKRIKAGLKQKDISSQLGYTTPQYISNTERGACTPPLKEARALCDVLSIPKKTYKKYYMQEISERFDKAWDQ